jgi:hypothetical protein
MMMVTMPLTSVAGVEEYPPPERVTVPVGVAPEPVTVTFTLRLDAVLTLDAAGVTLTVALSPVIVSDAEPLPVG